MVAEEVFIPTESRVLSDDNPWNAELHDCAAAHHAGAERRVENRVAIGALTAGLAKRVHFTVRNRVTLLHALIVATGHFLATTCQNRADGASAFIEAKLRFLIGDHQHLSVGLGHHDTLLFCLVTRQRPCGPS